MTTTSRSSVGHRPGGAWRFDGGVTEVFDDMLRRSIPAYDDMRQVVTELAVRYYQPGSDVVDLGCSRGGAIAPLLDACPRIERVVGVEVSAPMREAAQARFVGDDRVRIIDLDLRSSYPGVRASVTLAVLVLQFIPIEYRPTLLAQIREHSVTGAVLLVVEKVLGGSPEAQEALTELYLDRKRRNGYSEGDIAAKRHSLEGVLVPIPARENAAMLSAAGYTDVECVWRCLNFAAWMARVPPAGHHA